MIIINQNFLILISIQILNKIMKICFSNSHRISKTSLTNINKISALLTLKNLFNKIMNYLILNLKNLSYNNKIMNH